MVRDDIIITEWHIYYYAGKQMSQVLTQNGGEPASSSIRAGLAPPWAEDVVQAPWSCDQRGWGRGECSEATLCGWITPAHLLSSLLILSSTSFRRISQMYTFKKYSHPLTFFHTLLCYKVVFKCNCLVFVNNLQKILCNIKMEEELSHFFWINGKYSTNIYWLDKYWTPESIHFRITGSDYSWLQSLSR